ncbi:hypothetical protein M378DRAFT_99051 [Amanita muscaria Koide BX008]|uniref:Symplekin n=1 Tax=Amanita muscaria (strain Koide BX008) TaxID=946122 RepID=A0A0C2TQE5_AMAMK|nr:hypothetical protein M378DRAFT_99051 [Amanita muscaria Koide BX008]
MASNPVDPLQTLQAALKVPANSKEQADLLAAFRESLESHPAPIPILVGTLIGIVVNAGDSLLKSWVIDLLHFAICRSTLSLEQRTQMSSQALDTLAQLLDDPNPAIVKVVIQCLATVYPLLFRLLCTNRSNPSAWNTLSRCKTRVLEFVWSNSVTAGVKFSAVKFMQRVILVQTRSVSDPRLQNKNDPNISFCPADHPFINAAALEAEGHKLFDGVIKMLYSSQNSDIVSALLNSWSTLVKLRSVTVPLVVTALRQWTPAALNGLPASSVKSVEKAVRILLVHISRIPGNSQYIGQINEALAQQAARMEQAAVEEKQRKVAALTAVAESRKRSSSITNELPVNVKRPKLEVEATSTTAAFLASFDFTTLPATLITDLIVANLEVFSEPALVNLVEAFRQSRGLASAASVPPSFTPVPSVTSPQTSKTGPQSLPETQRREAETATPPPAPPVRDEPVDPLQMDIDQDELEYEPDRLNAELLGVEPSVDEAIEFDMDTIMNTLQAIDFKIPPPKDLSEDERISLIRTSITRISEGAFDLGTGELLPTDSIQTIGSSSVELWMLLIVRLVTRVTSPPPDPGEEEESKEIVNYHSRQDKLRQTLCDYIMADFPSRLRLAIAWMNEEWYNDQIRAIDDRNWRPNYDVWLSQVVASYQALLDGKDRTFARFLLDLPSLPPDVLDLLRELCIDFSSPEKMQVGYSTLRGLVIQRPTMRSDALNVLLELTTHPEKKTRGAAINTVKLWVPNTQPMYSIIREFALQMLRKLQSRAPPRQKLPTHAEGPESTNGDIMDVSEEHAAVVVTDRHEDDETMEDGQLPADDLVSTPYLPDRIGLPADKAQVLQHVEILLALSVKVPEFLDEIFLAYGQMDITVQEALQDLITALIRSLGPNHGKLLTLLRTCPIGAESLALRVLTIFTENGRASTQLVALVKGLVSERDLDPRFLIPIISEMDKPDIVRYLPRIVSVLDGSTENKTLVRSVFNSVISATPQALGTVSTNQPRVRQNDMLTPAELMVLLHDAEKEIGLKSAIEAIGICFSMTDVFRSEILAIVMQQIMDESVLPVLFLRTVIQAVTTYKSLVGFVSTTLLSRLITKKIWTNPPLWEGFIRCAKVIAPASFGALLQLPKDQLRELLDKQPSLKAGLRDYVTKKAPNRARGAGFLDIFGEPGEGERGPSVVEIET